MRRKTILLVTSLAIAFLLNGCGTKLIEMDEDQENAFVSYAAAAVAKYNKNMSTGITVVSDPPKASNSEEEKEEIEYKFYNDTCATVPEAAAAATQAFEKPVILITGGTDKGLDLDKLVQALCGKLTFDVKQGYFLDGTATQKIIPMLNQRGVHYFGPFGSLVELLQVLKSNLENQEDIDNADNLDLIEENDSEIIVFSPGATSFGMFANEFDRGNQFMNAVKEIF